MATTREDKATLGNASPGHGLGPSRGLVRSIRADLDEGDVQRVRDRALALHYTDVAYLIEHLPTAQREAFLTAIGSDCNPEVFPELDKVVRDEALRMIGFTNLAMVISALESDDAVYVSSMLDAEERTQVLSRLPGDKRSIIEQGLAFGERTAGRIMQRELVATPSYWSVGNAIDRIRASKSLPDNFHVLYVVDPRHRPVGIVHLSTLLRAQRAVSLQEIMSTDFKAIPVDLDQEEVAYLFRRRDLVSAPVVDASGRMMGRITVDDVVDIIDEETGDDMLRLAGVSETSTYAAVMDTVRSRFTWLVVNLGTAVLASLVIGLFKDTLERVVALAVLMPITASMGGNGGGQTLAAAVRGIATRDITSENAWRLVGKEALVGLINGVAFAFLAGAVAGLWFGDPVIAAVMGAAMMINMLAGGLFGIAIPLVLNRYRIDPAVASSVFLTTVTDVVGFIAFLGLAAMLLL